MNQLNENKGSGAPAKLRLDKSNAKLMGVCSGLANYFGMDPLVMRLIFAIGAIAGFGSFIVIYLAIGLLAD